MNGHEAVAMDVAPPVALAPCVAKSIAPSPDPEVAAMAKRRQFSSSHKRHILAEAQRCTAPGQIGALLRREGTQRMKRSGQRWSIDGGQAILSFRALAQSERFDGARKLVSAEYRRDVSFPENSRASKSISDIVGVGVTPYGHCKSIGTPRYWTARQAQSCA
jgi:hypothetical protein